MTSVAQGNTITLISEWYEFSGGPAVDLVTGPTIRIIRLSDNDNTVPETSGGIGHPSVGVYTFNWTVAADAQLGNYLAVWEGVDADSETVTANETIEVTISEALSGTWATPAEATSITGETITQAELNVAHPIIEIFAGATILARSNIKPRNIRLLKQAEAYQAAWMSKQVDLTGRSDVDLVTQDGLQYSKGDRDVHILSPLAKIALQRLSWRRSRPIEVLTPKQALALRGKRTPETIGIDAAELNTDIDEDGFQTWRPF